jgi:tRNA nucleotidyltransferase (CCA-adding enzyme)
MSDYMFMLESHLTSAQSAALAAIVAAAQETELNLFLTGASVRDMLGGFAIRDLDFAVEGAPSKLVKALVKRGAELISSDDHRKEADLRMAGGVHANLVMSRAEKYARPGARPTITAAPIYDHLRHRDFTINAMALSLNKGSRGLLIDPTNGAGDLQNREIRAISNYSLYDDPARILRLIRYQVRYGFAVEARTQNQYNNAREAEIEKSIPAAALRSDLVRAASEPNPGELVKAYERENLLTLFSPALTGAKVNHAGFQKLQKAMQLAPYGLDLHLDMLGLFLNLLVEKLSPKEQAAFIGACALTKEDVDLWRKLDARAKKLEKAVAAPTLKRASQIYGLLSKSMGDEIFYLLCRSGQRTVLDRLKNYLQKYLPAAHEVTDADVIARGGQPGTPKFEQLRAQVVSGRLDGRIRKPVPPPEPVPVAATAARRFN